MSFKRTGDLFIRYSDSPSLYTLLPMVTEAVPEPTEPEPTPEPQLTSEQPPAPEANMEQMDVEPTKPEEVKEEKPKEKPKSGNKNLVLIIVLLVLLVGLAASYFLGWLNPAFEWVLGLLGL